MVLICAQHNTIPPRQISSSFFCDNLLWRVALSLHVEVSESSFSIETQSTIFTWIIILHISAILKPMHLNPCKCACMRRVCAHVLGIHAWVWVCAGVCLCWCVDMHAFVPAILVPWSLILLWILSQILWGHETLALVLSHGRMRYLFLP